MLLVLTFDLEVDIPGSMAGNTFTTTRCIIAMFLVLHFLISVSGSIIAKDTNPVQLFLTFFCFSKIGFTTYPIYPYHKCVFSFLLPGVPGFLKDIKVELEKDLLSKLEFQARPKSIFFSPIENNCQMPWHNKVIRCFKDKKDENEPVTRKMMTFKDLM